MLRQLARVIDAVQERVGRFTSFVTLAMVLVVFTDVVLRYGFSRSSVFMQEMEWHLFAVGYLLAAGYTMLYDEHVRVDILAEHSTGPDESATSGTGARDILARRWPTPAATSTTSRSARRTNRPPAP
jgi:hypothetical protein